MPYLQWPLVIPYHQNQKQAPPPYEADGSTEELLVDANEPALNTKENIDQLFQGTWIEV